MFFHCFLCYPLFCPLCCLLCCPLHYPLCCLLFNPFSFRIYLFDETNWGRGGWGLIITLFRTIHPPHVYHIQHTTISFWSRFVFCLSHYTPSHYLPLLITININTPTTTNGIHNGLNTHHQLQSIVFVSFRVRNIRNNIVPNPIPFELLLLLILVLYVVF